MNLKQLEYFISVAEFLNFTKAAERHYIAQTAISHQIIALEKELELPLFYRNKRTVQLTSAGEVFYKEVKQIVGNLDQAVANAQRANSKYQGSLKIGFNGNVGKENLPLWIQTFLSAYPNIDLKLEKSSLNDLQDILEDDGVDILFRLSHDFVPNPKLSWKDVYNVSTDPLCVVLHRDHPYASQSTICRSQLINEPFVFWDQKSNPAGFDFIVKDGKNTGFIPNLLATASSAEALLLLVEAKRGITILPRCFEILANDTIRFIELEGENANDAFLIAVWRKTNFNPTIPMFFNIIKNPPASIASSIEQANCGFPVNHDKKLIAPPLRKSL
jgi:DNA-binding transcriptional LysR family regulator